MYTLLTITSPMGKTLSIHDISAETDAIWIFRNEQKVVLYSIQEFDTWVNFLKKNRILVWSDPELILLKIMVMSGKINGKSKLLNKKLVRHSL